MVQERPLSATTKPRKTTGTCASGFFHCGVSFHFKVHSRCEQAAGSYGSLCTRHFLLCDALFILPIGCSTVRAPTRTGASQLLSAWSFSSLTQRRRFLPPPEPPGPEMRHLRHRLQPPAPSPQGPTQGFPEDCAPSPPPPPPHVCPKCSRLCQNQPRRRANACYHGSGRLAKSEEALVCAPGLLLRASRPGAQRGPSGVPWGPPRERRARGAGSLGQGCNRDPSVRARPSEHLSAPAGSEEPRAALRPALGPCIAPPRA